MTDDIEYRLADHDRLEPASPALIEAARQEALDRGTSAGDTRYQAGFIDGIILLDRMLSDPEYFDIEVDDD